MYVVPVASAFSTVHGVAFVFFIYLFIGRSFQVFVIPCGEARQFFLLFVISFFLFILFHFELFFFLSVRFLCFVFFLFSFVFSLS